MTTFAQTLAAITGDAVVEEAGSDDELVLELRRGRAATWGESVGSQLVDMGVVRATDLLSGPVTYYTPTLSSYVKFILAPTDFEAIAVDDYGGFKVFQGTVTPDGSQVFPAPSPYVDWGHAALFPGEAWADASVRFNSDADKESEQIRYTTPVKAYYLAGNDGYPILSPPGAWAATHVYAQYAAIIGPDNHYWFATTAGTSAGSIPDFAGNEGGTVADGSVVWTDEGGVPTAGAFRVWMIVMEPPS